MFGMRSVIPTRRLGESWSECYQRACIDEAPEWIAERARYVRDYMIRQHARHATTPFPEVSRCIQCGKGMDCWKKITLAMYNGNPFSLKTSFLPYVEPEFFRPGAGTWGGSPNW